MWLQTKSTIHLIILNDNSEFGQKYNYCSIKFLRSFISSHLQSLSDKNLLDNLFDILNKHIPKSDVKISNVTDDDETMFELGEVVATKSDNKFFIKYKSTPVKVDQFNPKYQIIKDQFNPKYQIIEDEKYRIYIELPGDVENNIKAEMTDYRELEISGEKKREVEIEGKECFRDFGRFFLKFRIPEHYSRTHDIKNFTDGVLKVEFPKNKREVLNFNKK